jgi:site-specific DNA recombinase
MTRRCAIYMRYSSHLQRDASIEDQERRCRELAKQEAWHVVEQYVVADRAISGASLAGRDGLLGLIEVAKRKDRPFDCILFYNTERFARDVPDLIRSIDVLGFHGVDVVSVADRIDSAQPLGRQMFLLQGMHAEQDLVGLRDKVHRGQEGRVLKGNESWWQVLRLLQRAYRGSLTNNEVWSAGGSGRPTRDHPGGGGDSPADL